MKSRQGRGGGGEENGEKWSFTNKTVFAKAESLLKPNLKLRKLVNIKPIFYNTTQEPKYFLIPYKNIHSGIVTSGGAWVAQSVKHLTLDFGSGHGLTFMRLSPASGFALTVRSLLGILSLPLSVSLPFPFSCMHNLCLSLSVSHNK